MWYSSTYRQRVPITLDSAGATADYDVTIPSEWDAFWNRGGPLGTGINATGTNLRVVSADGKTVLPYLLDDGAGGAFVAANRAGRLRLDNVAVPVTAGAVLVWLYFDPATDQASGTSGAGAGGRSGYIEIARPGQDTYAHRPQAPGLSRPRDFLHKTSTEIRHIWIRYDHVLARRPTPGNGTPLHEEPLYGTVSVENSAGVDQAMMYDVTASRWVQFRGQLWLRVLLQSGASGQNYTLCSKVRTVLPGSVVERQTIETRIGVGVRDTRVT